MKRLCVPFSVLSALLYWPAFAEPGVTHNTIVFGQVAAFEGLAAAIGTRISLGLEAAFAEANRAGGVKGRRLVLISEDDGYEPDKSIEVANKLVNSGAIFALIGSLGTSTSAVIEPIASTAGVPFLAPFTGAQFLREPFNPNVVNLSASFAQEMETIVERLATDKGVSNIAILYQDDAMGRAILAGLRQALVKRRLEPVAEETFERNTVAVKTALLKIQTAHPQAVILAGSYKPCAEFIRLARELDLKASIAMGSYAGGNSLLEELGPAAAGVIVTQAVPPPDGEILPVAARFRTALSAASPLAKPEFLTFQAYLAGRVVIAALEKEEGEPRRQTFLHTILSSSFDLGGIVYSFAPGKNQGTNDVFVTVVQPDGSYKLVNNVRSVGHSW